MKIIDNIIGKKLVIVRTHGSCVDIRTYNSQELGLAKVLADKGVDVSIVFAGKVYEEHIILTSTGEKIKIYYVPYICIKPEISKFIGLNNLLFKLKPNIIQIHELFSMMSFSTLRWALKNNVKCVLIQGSYSLHNKVIAKYVEKIYNNTIGFYILNNVNGIGCKTDMAAKYISHYYKKPIFATRVGLDISRFDKSREISWREKLGLKKERILLYVGVLEKRKNVDLLIKSLSALPKDVVLLIVGRGEEKENLKNTSKTYNVSNRCVFIDSLTQDELPVLYSCCDLFLLPSSYEIYGMVILEAMYFSLPVIASVTAGSQTIIKNNETGILVSTFNIEDWANAILKLLNDSEIYYKIKNNTRKHIESFFTWDKTSAGFIELYCKALSRV
ncbi:D-inositol 3-phosphate glycosyltransferase [termite gut metagenome]|uniref:D-inositol 3-phosphate glycosyltransferase n=1 Tax=termite gut metagenome TaxID=433724 RepID=A0A5J4SD41_9ZZZZ